MISSLADAARHRRAHLRVVKIELRGLECGTRRLHVRFGFAFRVDPLIEFALRDDARAGQLLATLDVALGEQHARLRGCDLRLQAIDFGRIGRRVDGDQQIVPLHQRALAEVDRLNGARDA